MYHVRIRAQERNQDLEAEHDLHVKLSDDELVRRDLIKAWIDDTSYTTSGGDSELLRQRKASQILDIIWQDENALLPLLEKTESFKERVVTSTAKFVRSGLDVLNTKVKVFGQFDPTMTLRNYIFKTSFEGLKNTFQLLNHAAESRRRQSQDEKHDPPWSDRDYCLKAWSWAG
ncbi:hypothetical protein V8E54_004945 [Elaphomyces granulatus]